MREGPHDSPSRVLFEDEYLSIGRISDKSSRLPWLQPNVTDRREIVCTAMLFQHPERNHVRV